MQNRIPLSELSFVYIGTMGMLDVWSHRYVNLTFIYLFKSQCQGMCTEPWERYSVELTVNELVTETKFLYFIATGSKNKSFCLMLFYIPH